MTPCMRSYGDSVAVDVEEAVVCMPSDSWSAQVYRRGGDDLVRL